LQCSQVARSYTESLLKLYNIYEADVVSWLSYEESLIIFDVSTSNNILNQNTQNFQNRFLNKIRITLETCNILIGIGIRCQIILKYIIF